MARGAGLYERPTMCERLPWYMTLPPAFALNTWTSQLVTATLHVARRHHGFYRHPGSLPQDLQPFNKKDDGFCPLVVAVQLQAFAAKLALKELCALPGWSERQRSRHPGGSPHCLRCCCRRGPALALICHAHAPTWLLSGFDQLAI